MDGPRYSLVGTPLEILLGRGTLMEAGTSMVPSIMILESQEGDLSFPFSLKSLLFRTQTSLHRQVNGTIIWNHKFLFLPPESLI